MDNLCGICKKPFDDYLRVDCGGDCRVCLAASGDPDCINGLVSEIERLWEENSLCFPIVQQNEVYRVALQIIAGGHASRYNAAKIAQEALGR
jgi:hypothetical protein